MKKETLFVSFSGGRTSAYMSWWLINNKSDEYDFIFVFANTGQEHDKTLEFVDRCDKEWRLNLVWLEAVVSPIKNVGTTFKIVDFESASRAGEPFEDVIRQYGIPNADYPHCTRELKLQPIRVYKQSLGFRRDHQCCVGIRVDEIDRMNAKAVASGEIIYPLISWNPTTKAEVRYWWLDQNFDLEVPEHHGNCLNCWKKSDRKLMTNAKNNPQWFDWVKKMEDNYSYSGASSYQPIYGENDNGEQVVVGYDEGVQIPRKMFRRHRTSKDILDAAKHPFNEFVDHMPELQIGMDFPEEDEEEDCGAGCEIGADGE